MRKVLLSVAMMSSAITVMADRTIKGVVKDAKNVVYLRRMRQKRLIYTTNPYILWNKKLKIY